MNIIPTDCCHFLLSQQASVGVGLQMAVSLGQIGVRFPYRLAVVYASSTG